MFKDKRILVTGGGGFIGGRLASELIRKGALVRATIHHKKPSLPLSEIQYVETDLTLESECEKVVQGIDYVFMCAANTSGAAVIAKDPLEHVTANVVMNAFMLNASYRAGVSKFIFISSSIVYPPTGNIPSREDEAMIGEPYEAYFSAGWMKRYGELLCRTYSEKLRTPMATIVVRPSNVYGPFDKFDFERAHVTASLIRKVLEGQEPLEVWGTGEDVRDLIFIDDFIEGLLLAAAKLTTFNPINIASGTGYSIKDILNAIGRGAGRKIKQIVFDPSKPSMIPVRMMDVTKAQSLLGFKARTCLETGLKSTIDWYLAQSMNDCENVSPGKFFTTSCARA